MKKWILIIFVMSFLSDGDVLTKDYIDKGRTNIRSKTGETKGWLRKDFLDPNRINIYDKNGRQKGYLRKDMLNPENWRINKP